jgi:hypothetical protein
VSVVFLSILIVSLLKPLIINKLKRQTTTLLSLRREQQQQHGEQVHDEQQEQHQQEEQEVNDSHSQYRQRNRQQQQQQYSPYNLYLVFATIPDLFFGAYLVWRTIYALDPKYQFGEKWWVLLWNGSEIFLARGTLIYANIVMNACVGASIGVNAGK